MLARVLKRIILVVAIPIGLIILVLGYLGFVPGVSAMFGSDQPTDLEQMPTDADRVRANQKFQQTIVEADGNNGLAVLQGAAVRSLDITVTGAEAAAHIMERHPFTDLQIRINDDGTFTSSGKIDRGRISQYLETFGLTSYDGIDVLKTVDRYLPGSPAFAVEGQGSITDDEVTLQLTSAKLGRLSLAPQQFAEGLEAYVETLLEKVPGLDVGALRIADGQIEFIGSAPGVIPKP